MATRVQAADRVVVSCACVHARDVSAVPTARSGTAHRKRSAGACEVCTSEGGVVTLRDPAGLAKRQRFDHAFTVPAGAEAAGSSTELVRPLLEQFVGGCTPHVSLLGVGDESVLEWAFGTDNPVSIPDVMHSVKQLPTLRQLKAGALNAVASTLMELHAESSNATNLYFSAYEICKDSITDLLQAKKLAVPSPPNAFALMTNLNKIRLGAVDSWETALQLALLNTLHKNGSLQSHIFFSFSITPNHNPRHQWRKAPAGAVAPIAVLEFIVMAPFPQTMLKFSERRALMTGHLSDRKNRGFDATWQSPIITQLFTSLYGTHPLLLFAHVYENAVTVDDVSWPLDLVASLRESMNEPIAEQQSPRTKQKKASPRPTTLQAPPKRGKENECLAPAASTEPEAGANDVAIEELEFDSTATDKPATPEINENTAHTTQDNSAATGRANTPQQLAVCAKTPIPTTVLYTPPFDDWNFNAFDAASQLGGVKELFAVTFEHTVVACDEVWERGEEALCDVDSDKLRSFARRMQQGYRNNPYHNSFHACDVMQVVNFFFELPCFSGRFTPVERLCAGIAACIHDYKHIGRNTDFLRNTLHPLYIRANGSSPLENMHAADSLAIALGVEQDVVPGTSALDAGSAWLTDVPFAARSKMVSLVSQLVLCTDMAKHGESVSQFQALSHRKASGEDVFASEADRLLMLKMLLKLADLSNTFRPWVVCELWAKRMVSEYSEQGADEKGLGLPMSKLAETPLVPLQCGFLPACVLPLLQMMQHTFGEFAQFHEQCENNYKSWLARSNMQ
eukprot:TRINITY_DN9739_c0_g1_i1.p1 TRINITY_DN9739_c0_g1~~TRINITY_DN9739_c0_g1_i1.p1  ORF type:complete len:810 (+),score=144.32 TRINITY_DN9739_c0_g1_i1:52-2430(+)